MRTNGPQARYEALSIQRRLRELEKMMARDPSLVRMAVGDGGDRYVFWYDNGREAHYNVTHAAQRLTELQQQFPDALKSRTGAAIELPLLLR